MQLFLTNGIGIMTPAIDFFGKQTYSTYSPAEAEKYFSHHGLNLPWLPWFYYTQKKNFMDDTDKIMHNGDHFEIVCHAHQKANLRWPYSQKTFLSPPQDVCQILCFYHKRHSFIIFFTYLLHYDGVIQD